MLCSDASPVHPVLKDLLLGADVITPMICTDASPVQPVLKTWLLRDLHRLWNTVRPMHRCPFLNHRFIRCLKADLASIPFCTKIPWRRFFRQPSDAPVLHASVLPTTKVIGGTPIGAALWALLQLSSLSLCHHLNLKA